MENGYGLYWSEWSNEVGKVVCLEKYFESPEDRAKFMDKVYKKSTFYMWGRITNPLQDSEEGVSNCG